MLFSIRQDITRDGSIVAREKYRQLHLSFRLFDEKSSFETRYINCNYPAAAFRKADDWEWIWGRAVGEQASWSTFRFKLRIDLSTTGRAVRTFKLDLEQA